MRDLEIRGVGNLLGENQSGHIAAVGYDLYMQMVTEAVAELKGEEVREPAEIKLDIDTNAHLPARLRRRVRTCASRPTAAWRPWPTRPTSTTSRRSGPTATARHRPGRGVAHHRAAAAAPAPLRGIRELTVARSVARISPVDLPASKRVRLQRLHPKAVHKADLRQLVIPVPPAKEDSAASFLLALLDDLIPAGRRGSGRLCSTVKSLKFVSSSRASPPSLPLTGMAALQVGRALRRQGQRGGVVQVRARTTNSTPSGATTSTSRRSKEANVPVEGDDAGTFNPQFVARILTRRIYLELIHQEFVRRKLKLTDEGPGRRPPAARGVDR